MLAIIGIAILLVMFLGSAWATLVTFLFFAASRNDRNYLWFALFPGSVSGVFLYLLIRAFSYLS